MSNKHKYTEMEKEYFQDEIAKDERMKVWQILICTIIACSILYWWMGPHRFKTNTEPPKQTVNLKAEYKFDARYFGKAHVIPNEAIRMIKRHEGVRDTVYMDSEGNATIGVGFNLYRKDAKDKIKLLGLDYGYVLAGKTSLTDQQIEQLFMQDLLTACKDAKAFLPNFEKQPRKIQIVLIDMSFNLGSLRLNQFVKFRQALINKNYVLAADEMVRSKWYNQVGDRSKELVEIVKWVSIAQKIEGA